MNESWALLFIMTVLPAIAWVAQNRIEHNAQKGKYRYRFPIKGDIVQVKRNTCHAARPYFELGETQRLKKGDLLRVVGPDKDESYFRYETSPGVEVRFPTKDVTLIRNYLEVDKGEIEIGDTVMILDMERFFLKPKPDGSGYFKKGDTFVVTSFEGAISKEPGYVAGMNTFSFKPHQVTLIKKAKKEPQTIVPEAQFPDIATQVAAEVEKFRQLVVLSGCIWDENLSSIENATRTIQALQKTCGECQREITDLRKTYIEQCKTIDQLQQDQGKFEQGMSRTTRPAAIHADSSGLQKAYERIEKMIADLDPKKLGITQSESPQWEIEAGDLVVVRTSCSSSLSPISDQPLVPGDQIIVKELDRVFQRAVYDRRDNALGEISLASLQLKKKMAPFKIGEKVLQKTAGRKTVKGLSYSYDGTGCIVPLVDLECFRDTTSAFADPATIDRIVEPGDFIEVVGGHWAVDHAEFYGEGDRLLVEKVLPNGFVLPFGPSLLNGISPENVRVVAKCGIKVGTTIPGWGTVKSISCQQLRGQTGRCRSTVSFHSGGVMPAELLI